MNPIRIVSTQERSTLNVRFWPTDICNFNCTYCFPGSHDGRFRYPKDLNKILKTFRNTFDNYISLGKTNFHLTISGGGEPTLWPDIEEFCRQLKETHNVYITLVSNGSRTLNWWKTNYHYFDDVVLSYHEGQAKIDHHCEVADFLYEQNIKVTSLVLMDYQNWDNCVYAITLMLDSKHPWIIQTKEIVDAPGHGTDCYTAEQKLYLNNSIKRIPDSEKLLERIDDFKLHQSVALFSDNSAEACKPHTIIMNAWNNFKGWKCNLAMESIIIDHNGFILGSCGEMLNGFEPIQCPRLECSCQPDTHISKFKFG